MAENDRKPNHMANSPLVLIPLLLGVAILFATMAWFGARREMAALYGMIRSVEFPFINRFAPHAEHFTLENLRGGTVPAFGMIYQNSLVYGLFFTALILTLMMLALLRLEKFSILNHVTIRSDKGRTHREVMERLAREEPSVRFFLDYDLMDLPTTEGTGRQPMRAIELLLYTDTIRHVMLDPGSRKPPELDIDTPRLKAFLTGRFGRVNPFVTILNRRLRDTAEIERAVDQLSWYAALVLYPALLRVHAFHVENKEGYETTQADIDAFIAGIWEELNGFKKEFGGGIALGFASAADREERNALYRAKRAAPKGRKRKGAAAEEIEIAASTILDNLTDLARVHRRGRIDRGEIEPDGRIDRSLAGPERPAKAVPPENLLFFGEVLSERGPGLACVRRAREGLKDILTRHLGTQRNRYPVGTDPKTGLVVYDRRLATPEQKAFNTKAQERLATAEQAVESVLFNHQFEFSATGGALEQARRYGIMPPNLFRWLRFCDETASFWWFIQNLGMPAAYPENAAHFEHYQAERAMGVAVERPHINACIDGIRQEAHRYLVPERVDELRTILGRNAIVTEIVQGDAVAQLMTDFDKIIAAAAKGQTVPGADSANASPVSATSGNTRFARPGVAPATGDQPRLASPQGILDAFDLDED
jgi:hypothetical protein